MAIAFGIFRTFKTHLCSIQFAQKICGLHVQSVALKEVDLSQFESSQVKLLDEVCIAVDDKDNVVGPTTKKECHLMKNIKKGLMHRAFSVLLFNSKGEFLMQQRSYEKIIFPGYFSNTCCSHPLYIDSELEDTNALGVKRAALRKLQFELGIDPGCINIHELVYVTRMQYTATWNETWGEKEIAYLLFIQKEVEIQPNPHEVRDYFYLSKDRLKNFLDGAEKGDYKISPWFKLVAHHLLPTYWDNLQNLNSISDHKAIHHLH